ncbi:hypothetical protein CLAFUW4_03187 [Fulvia fulva]|uniref:Uncharacterized protein n=1 Tax=Passalora fulva TaxID=5499 RepID=A0A9Q8P5K1_PASFU|nr:uncharacterized protein CLAFUR5_03171 [Fulvia fulva]KAK4632398.1 hypothetical protein CLAFUR4_03176 [Fulvia fulva]KAK4632891.1 hypothetical protein CLAFUR0_03180 [Fulvia fulva]UJO13847.1 hypothetical protein CLAFUR5_03171 [Fulvia fulva]WPV11289.1 hypothetical protein CLAFUW4_03187 [Fulvia fulva]WPV25418.1 hypothetical protein CLAFUW7_03180 [Fulvia fulva]
MSILYDILVAEQLREIPQPRQTREQLLEKYYQSKMYSDKSAKSTKSDSSSIVSKDSTMSTAQLIKKKCTPRLKSSQEKSAGEKQAERRADRPRNETFASYFALK